jgi:hypothetical protein
MYAFAQYGRGRFAVGRIFEFLTQVRLHRQRPEYRRPGFKMRAGSKACFNP